MENNFRKSMTGLHTYTGLILGWLLFAIFVTGTSSYYQKEITLWMQPELHKSKETEKTLDIAIEKAIIASNKMTDISVDLPSSRSNVIKISDRSRGKHSHRPVKKQTKGVSDNGHSHDHHNHSHEHGAHSHGEAEAHIHGPNGEEIPLSSLKQNQTVNKNKVQKTEAKGKNQKTKRSRPKPTYYNANTGEKIKPRTTAGGGFLFRFHYELHSLPRNVATWIVGIATMSMLIAIITGIIIHKKIFIDMFTFRAKHGVRGWMDAHILPGVAAIPFLIMITYSGLLLFTNTMVPWAKDALYAENPREYRQDRNALRNSSKEKEVLKPLKSVPPKNTVLSQDTSSNEINRNLIRHLNNNARKVINKRTNNTRLKRITNSETKRHIAQNSSINKIENADEVRFAKETLKNIISQAKEHYPSGVSSFRITKDANLNTVEVKVSPKNPGSVFHFKRERDYISFDGNTGELISIDPAKPISNALIDTNTAFMSLHMIFFADPILRFTFFVFGIFGIVLIGTGLILWTEKRKHKNQKKKTFGFFLVEKLNIGTIVGLFVAIAVYFLANRLIPVDEPTRRTLEINAFFIAWALAYVHAFIRNTKKAWLEQLKLASILFMFIPILNGILTFESFSDIYTRDNLLIAFDLFFIIMSLVFELITFIAKRKFEKGERK